MKIIETLAITTHHHGHVGQRIDCPSIGDTSLDTLIGNLREAGINIDTERSEKKVTYSIYKDGTIKRMTVTVPYATQFPSTTSPVTLFLRNDNGLELKLSNYKHVTTSPPQGVIGGAYGGVFGIRCRVTIEGKTNLSSASTVLNKVKEALAKTYSDSPSVLR